MATIYRVKSTGKWRAEIRKKGLYKSRVFDTRIESQNWAYTTEAKMVETDYVVKGVSLEAVCQDYILNKSSQKRANIWKIFLYVIFAKFLEIAI